MATRKETEHQVLNRKYNWYFPESKVYNGKDEIRKRLIL